MCEILLLLDNAHAKGLLASLHGVCGAMKTGREELLIRVTAGALPDDATVQFSSITPVTIKESKP